MLLQMLEKGINSPLTSSCGRLFDGVAALVGGRTHAQYEGQAAMELEGLAWREWDEQTESADRLRSRYEIVINEERGMWIVDFRPMIRQLVQEVIDGVAISKIASNFHVWLAESTRTLVQKCAARAGIKKIVLSGGCMQNRLLLTNLYNLLEQEGFEVYTGEKVPVNDGGIALGQAFIGGRWYVSGNSNAGA